MEVVFEVAINQPSAEAVPRQEDQEPAENIPQLRENLAPVEEAKTPENDLEDILENR